jgi:hypothetical protein
MLSAAPWTRPDEAIPLAFQAESATIEVRDLSFPMLVSGGDR